MVLESTKTDNWVALARASAYRVSELAKRMNLSRRQLERKFSAIYKKTPRAWLFELRMTEAEKLLLQGESVKAVATIVGYGSCAAFCRNFKKHAGLRPSTFAANALRDS